VDDAKFRGQLLEEFNIEIAGGIGVLKGKIWRLGLMGYCSQKPFVLQLLGAMEKCLIDNGHRVSPGAGVGAANAVYIKAEAPAMAAR
jgi:alanine-glyoxylate transaminase/serine-glyoxylate transaminase/serine-pyruvate transaminase